MKLNKRLIIAISIALTLGITAVGCGAKNNKEESNGSKNNKVEQKNNKEENDSKEANKEENKSEAKNNSQGNTNGENNNKANGTNNDVPALEETEENNKIINDIIKEEDKSDSNVKIYVRQGSIGDIANIIVNEEVATKSQIKYFRIYNVTNKEVISKSSNLNEETVMYPIPEEGEEIVVQFLDENQKQVAFAKGALTIKE